MKTFIDTFMNEVKNTNKKSLTQAEIFQLVWNCQKENNIISSGNVTLDKNKYTVKVGNAEPQKLEKLLFNMLEYMINREGKVVTREMFFRDIWGSDVIVCTRSVNVAMCKIRKVVGENNVHTIKRVGYMFESK